MKMDERFWNHGDLSWCELMTTDVEAAKKFYKEIADWTYHDMPMGEMGTYTVFKAGEQAVGGIMTMAEDLPPGAPPHWSVYITVKDVDEVARKAQELGGTIIMPPRDIPKTGRFCVIRDPQGAVLAFIQYNEM
jgi:predicted enzyme related to lactoylglutathione lyase